MPHTPMYDTDEVPEDPQARHLQLFVEAAHPAGGRWTTVRSPVSFDGERALQVSAPPLLGDHDAALHGGAPVWSERRDGDAGVPMSALDVVACAAACARRRSTWPRWTWPAS